jgi:hypothetical protein
VVAMMPSDAACGSTLLVVHELMTVAVSCLASNRVQTALYDYLSACDKSFGSHKRPQSLLLGMCAVNMHVCSTLV